MVIGPDKERRPVKLFLCLHRQIVVGIPGDPRLKLVRQLWRMVAEHDDHRRLVHLPEVGDQIFNGLIRQLQQRKILIRLAAVVALAGHVAFEILVGIAAVILHGDVEQKQRFPFLLLLVEPDDLLIICLVADHVPVALGV